LLSACATAPTRNDQLEQARMEVQSLAQDPDAERAAGQQLHDAQADLARAEDAFNKRATAEEVTYLAYLAQRQAQTGKARIDELHARDRVAQGEAERTRIQLDARTQQAQNATTAAQNATAAAQAAQQQLADLKAKQTQRGMVLTLSDVLFDTNQATLKPGASLTLDRIGQFMQQNPNTRVMIEGFTDSTGSAAYNQELSQRRAMAVSEALTSRGIADDRIQTSGRGQDFPVASNATEAGRQQNRRVEIVFSDEAGRFAQQQSPTLR
jgi:outer membrane protein OmpA-like peptidoglycan-associated protein